MYIKLKYSLIALRDNVVSYPIPIGKIFFEIGVISKITNITNMIVNIDVDKIINL